MMSNLVGLVGHKRVAIRHLGHKLAWLCSINRSDKPCKTTRVKLGQGKGVVPNPVATAEHRSRNREKRASCLSPWRVVCARRVEASADSGEKRKGVSAAPGGLFFRPFLLAEQKKWTQGAGAEPPAISFSKSKAAFRRLLVIQDLDPRFRGDDGMN